MWVGILRENVLLALEAAGQTKPAVPNRQYAGIKQHCVLYTDTKRALYRARAELLAQTRWELKGAVQAEKRGGKVAAPPDIPAGRDLRTFWTRQDSGEVGCKRTVSEYDGPEERRAAYRAQALVAVAPRRYLPTDTHQKETSGGVSARGPRPTRAHL